MQQEPRCPVERALEAGGNGPHGESKEWQCYSWKPVEEYAHRATLPTGTLLPCGPVTGSPRSVQREMNPAGGPPQRACGQSATPVVQWAMGFRSSLARSRSV
eukprot:11877387-Heterocapsa_arctica.AAC.1